VQHWWNPDDAYCTLPGSVGQRVAACADIAYPALKALMAKYPTSGKGKDVKTPGQDLFDAFRPCYVRSFSDAKDYKKDTGEVIAGTKGASIFASLCFYTKKKQLYFILQRRLIIIRSHRR
jgi:hypothetical protein